MKAIVEMVERDHKNAYLNYFSQAYFVEHMVISERFFRHLVERPEEKQIPVCRLAILKYLAFS